MKDKVILVDCDGVILDWVFSFQRWLVRHGYPQRTLDNWSVADTYDVSEQRAMTLIRMFNESAQIRKLSPYKDAVKYVKKLHEEHGYIFHAITALSDDEYSQHLRTKNLRELFGPTVFDKFVYLDTDAPKDKALEEYKDSDCYWVEDKMQNAVTGQLLGLNALMMDHPHNQAPTPFGVRRVKNWKEIYKIITQDV